MVFVCLHSTLWITSIEELFYALEFKKNELFFSRREKPPLCTFSFVTLFSDRLEIFSMENGLSSEMAWSIFAVIQHDSLKSRLCMYNVCSVNICDREKEIMPMVNGRAKYTESIWSDSILLARVEVECVYSFDQKKTLTSIISSLAWPVCGSQYFIPSVEDRKH